MNAQRTRAGRHPLNVDAEVGHRLIEVKVGASAVRSIRMGFMQLVYALEQRPNSVGFLVLADTKVTKARLQQEWSRAVAVLRSDLRDRLVLCIGEGDHFIGFPHDPDAETQRILAGEVAAQRPQASLGLARTDASFVVSKVLFNRWLKGDGAVTNKDLARACGCSYPTVAGVLEGMGDLLETRSDRKIQLRWFPKDEFAFLEAVSSRARATVRFADRSGQPRSVESHLRRLEKLNPPGLAIGGVLGAKHYFPDLDLVGAPRLDLSLHSPGRHMDLGIVTKLDPALKPVEDPLEPASLAVHAVRHADPLFAPRDGGLAWADPVECFLDLHEARLGMQARQFLNHLKLKAKARMAATELLQR